MVAKTEHNTMITNFDENVYTCFSLLLISSTVCSVVPMVGGGNLQLLQLPRNYNQDRGLTYNNFMEVNNLANSRQTSITLLFPHRKCQSLMRQLSTGDFSPLNYQKKKMWYIGIPVKLYSPNRKVGTFQESLMLVMQAFVDYFVSLDDIQLPEEA